MNQREEGRRGGREKEIKEYADLFKCLYACHGNSVDDLHSQKKEALVRRRKRGEGREEITREFRIQVVSESITSTDLTIDSLISLCA